MSSPSMELVVLGAAGSSARGRLRTQRCRTARPPNSVNATPVKNSPFLWGPLSLPPLFSPSSLCYVAVTGLGGHALLAGGTSCLALCLWCEGSKGGVHLGHTEDLLPAWVLGEHLMWRRRAPSHFSPFSLFPSHCGVLLLGSCLELLLSACPSVGCSTRVFSHHWD